MGKKKEEDVVKETRSFQGLKKNQNRNMPPKWGDRSFHEGDATVEQEG